MGNLEPDVQEMLLEEAIVLEPRSQFNECIVGVASTGVLVYSAQECINSFIKQGMEEDEAIEFFHYNTMRTMEYVSKETRPIFLVAERPSGRK